MAFSYSFHMSNKGSALKNGGDISNAGRHNLREYKQERGTYNANEIEVLIGSSSILDDVKQIYHAEFDEALERYNAKQTRNDRRIDDYFEHVSGKDNDVACEFIIQVGDMDFWQDKSMQERKQMTYIFQDQLRALQKLVPELKVASAVIHYDEKSPHMHVIGVPVADGYTKGLEKQVSKRKVFTKERLSYLQDRMRENVERGMEMPQNANLFADMELKAKEKGRNKDIPKQSLAEFYELEAQKKEIVDELEVKNSELVQARYDKLVLRSDTLKLKQELADTEEQIKEKNEVIEPLETQISLLSSQMDNLQAEADEIVSEAKLKAKSIVDEAQTEALSQKEKYRSAYENILNSARSKADEIVSGAKTEAKGIVDEAQEVADTITHAAFSNADLQTVKKENEKLKAENTWLKGVIQNFHDKLDAFYWPRHEDRSFEPLRELLGEVNKVIAHGFTEVKRTLRDISNLGH